MRKRIRSVALRPEIIIEVLEAAGGLRCLSRSLGISSAAVARWGNVPAERCLEVERITGVSRYRLRPDVYGPEPEPAARPRARAIA